MLDAIQKQQDPRATTPGPTDSLPPVDEVYQRAQYTADMNGLSESELAERRAQMEETRMALEAWSERIVNAIRDHDTKISRCDRALNALRGNDEPQEAVAR